MSEDQRRPPEALIAPILRGRRLIAVVNLEDWRSGPPVARALVAGGVSAVEITLRTPAGLEAVRAAAAEVPDAVVGAGTCLTTDDLDAAAAAGAAFAVSPGLSLPLLPHATCLALPYMPAVATASELMTGLETGYRTFKFFPAVPAGGADYLKALAGPFGTARFCPTGGVTLSNAKDFLALETVACVGGSWLTPADAVRDGDWRRIEDLARAAVSTLGGGLSPPDPKPPQP